MTEWTFHKERAPAPYINSFQSVRYNKKKMNYLSWTIVVVGWLLFVFLLLFRQDEQPDSPELRGRDQQRETKSEDVSLLESEASDGVTPNSSSETSNKKMSQKVSLDCGKPANFTYYDHLIGIANRHNHPTKPEPQVAVIFNQRRSPEMDLETLEKKLRKAKVEVRFGVRFFLLMNSSGYQKTFDSNRTVPNPSLKCERLDFQKPRSVQLYNQLGNYWRIKGNTQRSIECFRKALAISPNNAEVLLDMAQVSHMPYVIYHMPWVIWFSAAQPEFAFVITATRFMCPQCQNWSW